MVLYRISQDSVDEDILIYQQRLKDLVACNERVLIEIDASFLPKQILGAIEPFRY